MIAKTRGVVFRFTRYGETSIIVTIFTEVYGLQSYIVNGIRSSKSSAFKMALFQPLTLLDLVVYHKEHAHINRIREVKCLFACHSISSDIKKTAIGMFVQEILNKSVKEDATSAPELFQFLLHSLLTLDHQQADFENFHLIFLLKLSRFLGFEPQNGMQITGSRFLNHDIERDLDLLLKSDYHHPHAIPVSRRRELLDAILHFFKVHIEGFGEPKSLPILREVLAN